MESFYYEEKEVRLNSPNAFDLHNQTQSGTGTIANAHYHEYIEILYCREGSFEAVLGGKSYLVSSGDIIIINSNEVHRTTALSNKSCNYLVVKFDSGLLFSSEEPAYSLKFIFEFSMAMSTRNRVFTAKQLENSMIPELFSSIEDEYYRRDYGYEIAVKAGILQIFLWLLRQWRNAEHFTVLSGQTPAAFERLQQIINYVNSNYSGKINMKEVCELVDMPYSSFSRFFTKTAGKCFTEYVMEIRISKAKILLATSNMSITDIAMESGFSTTSHFIQCFREKNSQTPHQFRKIFANT